MSPAERRLDLILVAALVLGILLVLAGSLAAAAAIFALGNAVPLVLRRRLRSRASVGGRRPARSSGDESPTHVMSAVEPYAAARPGSHAARGA